MKNILLEYQDRIRQAIAKKETLTIRGHGSKDFYGGPIVGAPLSTTPLAGITEYMPGELMLSAYAGTPLQEISATLAKKGQMLPFDPPFVEQATLGGAIAVALAGARRPFSGSVRDALLGVKILDGQGQVLRFGGKVMKNVAGFDVAKFLAGSMGALGLLLEITIKVLPRPKEEWILYWDCDEKEAIALMNQWQGQPLPLTGLVFVDCRLWARLSGTAPAIAEARRRLGGNVAEPSFFTLLQNYELSFFKQSDMSLWRLDVPSTTPPLDLGATLLDWGGARRWIFCQEEAAVLRQRIAALDGKADVFWAEKKPLPAFHPLWEQSAPLMKRLRQVFDPYGIWNIERLLG